MTTQTAESLRDEEDLWPLIDAKVNHVMLAVGDTLIAILTKPGLAGVLEAKYREGEALHKRDWLSWTTQDKFSDESADEIHDFVLYQAMKLVWLDATNGVLAPLPGQETNKLGGMIFG